MKKNIVILGATGFIGRAVAGFFHDSKHVNLFLASKKGGKLNSLMVHPLDLTKQNSLANWPQEKKIDCIIYLSSMIPASFDESDLKLFYLNIRMHQQVLKYWLSKKCHLIYASSCSVYGRAMSTRVSEATVPLPDNYYAISKLIGEHIFLKEFYEKGRPVTVLRINAPYGYKKERKTVVNIFLEKALRGEPLELMGSGKREQDFIYADDVARAFWAALVNKKYGVFNIASGHSVTMRQLAKLIVQTVHSSSDITFARQPDPQQRVKVKIDIKRSQNELSFELKYSLKDGLREMAALYSREELSK